MRPPGKQAMVSRSEALPPRMSLGIASGPTDRDACLCVLDHALQSLSTFAISASGRPIRQQALDEGRCDAIDDANISAMAEFLAQEIPLDTATTVLVEVQKVFPHPDYGSTPAGVFSWHAASLGALVVLATQPLGVPVALGCYEVPDREAIVVHHVIDAGQQNAALANSPQPRILGRGLLRACAGLVLDKEPTPPQLAAVAGLLARAPGAYYYWSTFGEPPSLGDVILHHSRAQQQMLVVSPTENFKMRVRAGPQTAEDISLAYTLAVQAHQELGATDAHKLALVHVCKEFGYDLRCYSHRADARGVDPRRAWPWPDEDAWALEEIRRLRG